MSEFNTKSESNASRATRIWKSENKCKDVFEHLFKGYKFEKQRLYFLDNLELDGYCPRLLLVFEYDGKQHFKHVKIFHKTKRDFEAQKSRDRKKDGLCVKNGVKLVRIPYNYANTGLTLEIYIVEKLKKMGYRFKIIMVPRYIAIVDEVKESKKIKQEVSSKAKELNAKLCKLLDIKHPRVTTTREMIMSNKRKLDRMIPELRNEFGLKSTSQPKTITGYLSFLNSVFRKCGRSLIAIETGVYQLHEYVKKT